jgi:hypothetical protein
MRCSCGVEDQVGLTCARELNLVTNQMNRSSSPGYPWIQFGNTIGQVLDVYGSSIKDAIEKRLKTLTECRYKLFDMTPEELVEAGCCDPVKVFIKEEPHKIKKILSGKLRIISSVSMVDQGVTRMLCRRQNKAEIESWESCPSAPGIGLNDEGLRVIDADMHDMIARHGSMMETDVSGWDWSVQQWELDVDAECRARLAGAERTSLFAYLLRAHAYIVGNPVYVLPDGTSWKQTFSGGQLSGDYNTSSSNSRMRIIASLVARIHLGVSLAGPIDVKAMGDDSYERNIVGMDTALGELGHEIKMIKVNTTVAGSEFCSHEFHGDGTASPVNVMKTLYKFLTHKDSTEYPTWLAQLSYEMRHLSESRRDKILGLAIARAERANIIIPSA